MATPPMRPTTPTIKVACDALEAAIGEYWTAQRSVTGYEQYESTTESLNLFNLAIRDIEATLLLARSDLALLPAAYVCARAALEVAVKAAWMVDANDGFVREVRWLAHLQEEERVYERVAKRAGVGAVNSSQLSETAATENKKKFRLDVTGRLPPGITPLKRNPPMDEMLASLRGDSLYAEYIYMSQFVHGGHAATWLYRKHLGTKKIIGDHLEPRHWYAPLRVCWLSLVVPGSVLLFRLGFRAKFFITATRKKQIDAAIERINVT